MPRDDDAVPVGRLPGDYHPHEPLTADATDSQIYERALALRGGKGLSVVLTAREFASACVAADRTKREVPNG